MGKLQKHTKTLHTRALRGQPFPSRKQQDCKEQTRQYDRQTRYTNNKKRIHKRNTALEWSVKRLKDLNLMTVPASDKHELQINLKDPQKKHHLGKVRKKILEGLKMFDSTSLTLFLMFINDNRYLVNIKDQ